jgi:hypothetical protein
MAFDFHLAVVVLGVWNRTSLQLTLLGTPACGNPSQIFFGADPIDRHQFAFCADEPERRAPRKRMSGIAKLAFYANRRRKDS